MVVGPPYIRLGRSVQCRKIGIDLTNWARKDRVVLAGRLLCGLWLVVLPLDHRVHRPHRQAGSSSPRHADFIKLPGSYGLPERCYLACSDRFCRRRSARSLLLVIRRDYWRIAFLVFLAAVSFGFAAWNIAIAITPPASDPCTIAKPSDLRRTQSCVVSRGGARWPPSWPDNRSWKTREARQCVCHLLRDSSRAGAPNR